MSYKETNLAAASNPTKPACPMTVAPASMTARLSLVSTVLRAQPRRQSRRMDQSHVKDDVGGDGPATDSNSIAGGLESVSSSCHGNEGEQGQRLSRRKYSLGLIEHFRAQAAANQEATAKRDEPMSASSTGSVEKGADDTDDTEGPPAPPSCSSSESSAFSSNVSSSSLGTDGDIVDTGERTSREMSHEMMMRIRPPDTSLHGRVLLRLTQKLEV